MAPTLSFWQRRSRADDVSCDVAVVGGGIVGCSAAYWLRRLRPACRVVIVEAQRLAAGASGRNAGFLLQGGTAADYHTDIEAMGAERTRRLWHFTKANRDLVASELDTEAFRLETSGSLIVAGSDDEEARLRASVGPMRADGASVAYLSPQETNRRLRSEGFGGSLLVTTGAALDPVLLVRHIAAASEAEVLEHHPVVAVDLGRDIVLETPTRRIRAGQAVFALNAYGPRLFPDLASYVRPVRAQMLATVPMAHRWLSVPTYSHEGYFYVRQTPDGAVLVGGARHLHRAEEVGYRDTTTPALQADLEAYLHTHFPQTRSVRVAARWSGTMGFSPDHVPILGEIDDAPGSVWAGGFSGHGVGYGFRFGKLIAERVLELPHPEGLDLFSPDRFAR